MLKRNLSYLILIECKVSNNLLIIINLIYTQYGIQDIYIYTYNNNSTNNKLT